MSEKTEYEVVKERFETLHASRREIEGKLRQFSRAEYLGQVGPGMCTRDQYVERLLKHRESLESLRDKEGNVYAACFIESIDERLSVLKKIEKPSNKLTVLHKEKKAAEYAYDNFINQDRHTKSKMSPEGLSCHEFEKKLKSQFNEYYRNSGIPDEDPGEKYLLMEDLSQLIDTAEKTAHGMSWPSEGRQLGNDLKRIKEHIEMLYQKNEDLIIKEKYPLMDIVDHYANRFLNRSNYLIQDRDNHKPEYNDPDIPIGQWDYS